MATQINNQASTTYQFSGGSEVLTAISNENTMTLKDASGLSITKTANPTTFGAGDIITYTVRITNNSGSYLNGVRIIDDLGGGNLAYVVGSGNLMTSTGSYPVTPVAVNPLTFTLQQLGVGASMTLTYRSQVIFNLPSTTSSITNNVRGIGYTSTGTITGSDTETILKKNSQRVELSKTSSMTSVEANQEFSYYLTLQNLNTVDAIVLSITDQLPSNFVLTDASLKIGTGSTVPLLGTDYTLTLDNLFTLPSATGPFVTVPSGGTTVVTLTGYFG